MSFLLIERKPPPLRDTLEPNFIEAGKILDKMSRTKTDLEQKMVKIYSNTKKYGKITTKTIFNEKVKDI